MTYVGQTTMRGVLDGGGKGTALVLGAGGPVGHAFHAGVLAALHEAGGFDARGSELIVGTSAGAGVGALLRAGMSGPCLLARVCGRPMPDRSAAIASLFRRPVKAETSPPRRWKPASPDYLWHAARRPWAARPARLVAALLPVGRTPLHDYAAGISTIFEGAWPDPALWITAVRLRDGKVVSFGRDDAPMTCVGSAVASSSAVPGVYAPVVVDGEHYIDGGMASPIHLDIAADAPTIQIAIVSSPLSRMPGMRAQLRAEIRRARRRGLEVIAIEPGPATIRAMGWNPMDLSRATAVAEAAYHETRERISLPPPRIEA